MLHKLFAPFSIAVIEFMAYEYCVIRRVSDVIVQIVEATSEVWFQIECVLQ